MEPTGLDLFEFEVEWEIRVGGWRNFNISDSSAWMLDKLWTYIAINNEVGICYGFGASMWKSSNKQEKFDNWDSKLGMFW